jgi:hypothetical protein
MRHSKGLIITLIVALLAFTSVTMAGKHHHNCSFFGGEFFSSDDFNIEIDGSSVLIINDYEDDEIEITDDYELYVNGDLIKLDRDQQKIVEAFHTQVMDIKEFAIEIGKEGAKIGIEGARIGLKAIGGVMKLIFTDYDEDDLDRDLERATEELELKAEALEEQAEEIEDMAEDLEDMFYDMEEEIPAVASLDW